MKKSTAINIFLNVLLLILDGVHLQNFSTTSPITKPDQESEKSQKYDFHRCSPTHNIMMVAKCPPEYIDKVVIEKCEKGLSELNEEDFSIIIPATNRKSSIDYANQYCATCHNDPSVELWELTVSVNNIVEENAQILSTLHYNETLKRYVVDINESHEICSFYSAKPQQDGKDFKKDIACYVDRVTLKSGIAFRSQPLHTMFKIRTSSKSCSIPAVQKYYCRG